MTWFEQSANQTEAAKEHYAPFIAVDFDFDGGNVRLWTGGGDLVISGNTYLGMGRFARVTSVPDRANLVVERKTYQLAGAEIDPAIVTETDIDASFGRSVTEYLGFINPDTGALLATPEVVFEGEISNIRRVDGPEPVIEVNAENRLVLLNQPDGWRYTHEHQQEFYAGDDGFDQVPMLETRQILWGGAVVTAGGGRGAPLQPVRLR